MSDPDSIDLFENKGIQPAAAIKDRRPVRIAYLGHVDHGRRSLTAALMAVSHLTVAVPTVADSRYPVQDYDGPVATGPDMTPRQARQLAKKLERKRQKKLRKTNQPIG